MMTAIAAKPCDDALGLIAAVNGEATDGVPHLEPFWMNTRYEQERFGRALASMEDRMFLARASTDEIRAETRKMLGVGHRGGALHRGGGYLHQRPHPHTRL